MDYTEENKKRRATMSCCHHCEKKLHTNEIAISMRLLGKDGRCLLCRDCLAAQFKVEPEVIDRKIQQFKALGCPLFV